MTTFHDITIPEQDHEVIRFWGTDGEARGMLTGARAHALWLKYGEQPCYRIWTTAPEDYDYPYCVRTGASDGALREVIAFTIQANAAGQMMRYQSGCYAATEPELVV